MQKLKSYIPAILLAVSTIFALVMNILAISLPLNNQTTQQISDKYPVFFTPASYVFSIWGIIYMGLIAFTVYQFLPRARKLREVKQILPAVFVSNLANGIWIIWWHFDQVALSVVTILVLLVSLIFIYSRLPAWKVSTSKLYRACVQLPFSIYLGWVSVASIANITVLLYTLEWNALNIPGEYWAALLCLVAADLAVNFLWIRRDYPFALVIIWAVSGIGIKFVTNGALTIAAFVGCGLILGMMLALLGRDLTRTRRTKQVLSTQDTANEALGET